MNGQPNDADDRPPAGWDFWLDVDGEPVHVLGDPNIDQDTLEAFVALVRAARLLRSKNDQEDGC